MPEPAPHPRAADLRIDAGWIIPVQPAGSVLAGHSLLLKDGRIVYVGDAAGASGKVPRD